MARRGCTSFWGSGGRDEDGPFVILATADAAGRVDASPKGGPPGFVAVLDDHHLAIPDMSGNNRLDSMRNITDGGYIPCVHDPRHRRDAAGERTSDDQHRSAVLDSCPVGELRPNVATIVEVRTAFIHCAKALRRAALWQHDQWPDTSDMATLACMLKDHIGLEGSVVDSSVLGRVVRSDHMEGRRRRLNLRGP